MSNQLAESKARTDAQLKSSLDKIEQQRQQAIAMMKAMGFNPTHLTKGE